MRRITIFCDICGKEVQAIDGFDYSLPHFETICDHSGRLEKKIITPKKCNLCLSCASEISHYKDTMKVRYVKEDNK